MRKKQESKAFTLLKQRKNAFKKNPTTANCKDSVMLEKKEILDKIDSIFEASSNATQVSSNDWLVETVSIKYTSLGTICIDVNFNCNVIRIEVSDFLRKMGNIQGIIKSIDKRPIALSTFKEIRDFFDFIPWYETDYEYIGFNSIEYVLTITRSKINL